MDEGGQGEVTPRQERERFSTGGLNEEESLRRVLVTGPGERTDEAYMDRELSDDELIEVWETTTAGVRDGGIQSFLDKSALIEHVRKRLGR